MQRQMMQWITALERAAKASHWVGSNRFESYAPIRLNVAAQWLVDGVCQHSFGQNSTNSMHSGTTCGTFLVPSCWHVSAYTSTTGGCHRVCHCVKLGAHRTDKLFTLSELQMRRPRKDKYRLDKLLERKAKEGVKIYVIL